MGGPPNDFFRLKGATQEETKPANKGAEIIMQCIYWKPSKVDEGANFVYYFNGANCSYISNGDSIKILKQIYKDNNGKDMPEDAWTYDAPCFSRLEAVVPVL